MRMRKKCADNPSLHGATYYTKGVLIQYISDISSYGIVVEIRV